MSWLAVKDTPVAKINPPLAIMSLLSTQIQVAAIIISSLANINYTYRQNKSFSRHNESMSPKCKRSIHQTIPISTAIRGMCTKTKMKFIIYREVRLSKITNGVP